MSIQWLRLWHEMPNDPKWRTIARASKQAIPSVIAVYMHLLVAASSNANERGRTESVCIEDVASALDLDPEQVEQIIEAMQGRVLEGGRISGWDKRQVEREDGSAARAKAWREAKKAEKEAQANAGERKQTPDKDKEKEKNINNKAPATPLPDWIPLPSWEAYLAMRKTIKKPLTGEGIPLAIAKLERLRAFGSAPKDVLEQSTLNSWQGLFEVKRGGPEGAPAPLKKDWE